MGWDGMALTLTLEGQTPKVERERGGRIHPDRALGASLLLVVFCPTEGVSLLL